MSKHGVRTGNQVIENVKMEREYNPGRPITLAEQLAALKEKKEKMSQSSSKKKSEQELDKEFIEEHWRKTQGIVISPLEKKEPF